MKRHFQILLWASLCCSGVSTSAPASQGLLEKPPNVKVINLLHNAAGSTDTTSREIVRNEKGVFDLPGLGIRVRTDFDGARANAVTRVGEKSIEVFIDSENKPINWSPWYSFTIEQAGPQRPDHLSIRLTYPQRENSARSPHRYRPKLSSDGGATWKEIENSEYNHEEGVFKVNLDTLPLAVSAQELMTSKDSLEWIETLSEKNFISYEVIGKSIGGRPLHMVHIVEGTEDDKEELFILSRQHPPEVTGYLAMRHFVEYLASEKPDAKAFRKKLNIRVAPMVNPDGVDDGHWRHNYGGIDLNRDWLEADGQIEAKFNQPETRQVSKAFLRFKERKVAFALDFHSTYRDVFYHDAAIGTNEYNLILNWIYRIGAKLPNSKLDIQGSAKSYSTTSKSWMRRQFGCPAVTYEVDDKTDREELESVAVEAAKSLIVELLERN